MSQRRQLGGASTGMVNQQAEIAARHLEQMDARSSERLEVNYPLNSLFPSPNNPRRLSLDRAGVNIERLQKVAIRPRESLEEWSARLEEFLASLPKNDAASIVVWNELLDLAINLYTSDLLQPIVAKHDGEIIAGERRWTASLIAGKTHNRVILRSIPEDMEDFYRLVENARRSDLSVSEVATSVRKVMLRKTGAPCGPENDLLTIQQIQSVLGVGQTQSAYYRAICCLPDNDEVLLSILAGGYTSLRTAYEDASKRVRVIKQASKNPQLLEPQGSTTPQNEPPPPPPAARFPLFKARIPGTEGGVRFLKALSRIEGLPDEVSESITTVINSWPAAPDKVRQNMLTAMMSSLFSSFDCFDDEDLNQEQETA